jgi:4-hydroxythreonine-4-phosphate dehydrogenase
MSQAAMSSPARYRPPLVLTMGEPAGIGGEIALKAWLRRRDAHVPPFFLLDDPARLEPLALLLGARVPVRVIAQPMEAVEVFDDALPVLPRPLKVAVPPGRPDAANADVVRDCIAHAVSLTLAGEAAAVVTNPIHKAVLYAGGFAFPGHTEYLAELAGPGVTPVMMLACPGLRVVPVTIHVALRDAVTQLTTDGIVACGRITAEALQRDFGIGAPRLALAGLNPHAGEGGGMGDEDQRIVAPAVAELRRLGIDATGPLPADTMFHPAARERYDAALCMYHDQALIPIKTIDFAGGVNVTLGLPFVRTSPDHGTAFDLAGTGAADPSSLIAALAMADQMARRRAATARLHV